MAFTPIDHTAVDRLEVSRAAFGYPVVDNLNDLNTRTTTVEGGKVSTARKIIAGTGLTGGGDLTADRTLAVSYGTVAGTSAQGNDSRFTDASARLTALEARKIVAGTGLAGGGDLTADRTLAVSYGTAAGTSAQGNDSRFTDASTRLALLQSYGRWNITADSVRSAGTTTAVGAWTVQQALAGVTVDAAGEWTFANAGVYELSFGWHASYNITPVGQGFNTNCFISDSALTVVYGQTQGYAVQYVAGNLELSATVYTGPVALAAAAKVKCWTGFAQQVTLTGADGFKRTFFAVRRLA